MFLYEILVVLVDVRLHLSNATCPIILPIDNGDSREDNAFGRRAIGQTCTQTTLNGPKIWPSILTG